MPDPTVQNRDQRQTCGSGARHDSRGGGYLMAGAAAFRRSVTGEARGPLCGMGICFECRMEIDGATHSRSCQIECREGMRVATG